MAVKIDKLDYKLLYHLAHNGRASLTALAKELGLSKQRIDYRLKRLEKLHVIDGYSAFIDGSPLGYTLYRVNLLTERLDKKGRVEFLAFLKGLRPVVNIVALVGRYDYLVDLCIKETRELMEFVNKVEERYGDNILSLNVAIAESRHMYSPTHSIIEGLDFLASRRELSSNYMRTTLKNISEDKALRVALAMEKQARASTKALAKLAKMSFRSFTEWKQLLEKKGIIKGYFPLINRAVLGYKEHKLFLALGSHKRSVIEEIKVFARGDAAVSELYLFTERWDAEFTIEVKTVEDLLNVIEHIKSRFSSVLTDVEEADIVQVEGVQKLF